MARKFCLTRLNMSRTDCQRQRHARHAPQSVVSGKVPAISISPLASRYAGLRRIGRAKTNHHSQLSSTGKTERAPLIEPEWKRFTSMRSGKIFTA